jgi:hypothetical protein
VTEFHLAPSTLAAVSWLKRTPGSGIYRMQSTAWQENTLPCKGPATCGNT